MEVKFIFKLLIILAVITFIFPSRINFNIYLDNKKIKGSVFLLLFGLLPLKKKFDFSFSEQNLAQIPAKLPDMPRPSFSLKKGKNLFQALRHNITIEKFKAELHLSLTDKFHLSLLNGIYWWIWGIFSHRLKPNCQLNFISEYQNISSFLLLEGIFSLSLAQIIFNTVLAKVKHAYFHLLRRFKHGQPSY